MTLYRNQSNGRFARQFHRAPDGKFAKPIEIVAGRLYNYKGATVRALKFDQEANARLVSFHKTLFGFVKDNQLQKIDRRKVETYLAEAK